MDDAVAVQDHCRKFYSTIYGLLGSVKGLTTDSTVWPKIMSSILLPVLGYGSELWNLESYNTKRLLHQMWRRGFRRGLGLPKSASLTEVLGQDFAECEDLLRRQQILFFWRVSHASNTLVDELILNRYSRSISSGWNRVDTIIQRQIMISSYMQFKDWIRSGVT